VNPAPAVAREGLPAEQATRRTELAWKVLEAVGDPEIPALSLVDLGLIRFVRDRPDGRLEIGLSPTYTGCPATAVIRRLVEDALAAAALDARCTTVLSPPWTSDWITPGGRRKLEECGIVPPRETVSSMSAVLRGDKPLDCPHCHSVDTERLSEFGSTPCKALHRCRDCLEPFEYFKCI
jgi:ring-1,2-phenylacetyl-CoA epoxidase subunit PaaD